MLFQFMSFDGVSFYSSITLGVLIEALEWATQYVGVKEHQKKVIMQPIKSFL